MEHAISAKKTYVNNSTSSRVTRRPQLREGGTSPTSLSPPFRVELSGGRSPIGPSDDGTNYLLGRHGADTMGTSSFPKVRPQKLLHSPTTNEKGKGASFYMPSPPTPERLRARRRRKQLVEGLDAQVNQRKMARDHAEYQELRKTLLSQQRLIEQGLDYWGQPVPEGDPRGTLRLMAVNTLKKLEAIGIDPNSIEDKYRSSPRADRLKNNAGTRIFDNTSYGGGSGPARNHSQSGGAVPFMGALAAMNGRSPEEKQRDERQRHKLQQSLKHQVETKKNKANLKEIEELRLLLKSRQAKLDKGIDHWGQRIPPNDRLCAAAMISDQVHIACKISEKQAQVDAFAVRLSTIHIARCCFAFRLNENHSAHRTTPLEHSTMVVVKRT